MIADELRGYGLQPRIEEEQVHGGYWWPIGLPTALSAVAGVIGGAFAVVAGLFSAAAVADDVNCERHWFRRRVLPKPAAPQGGAEGGPAGAAPTPGLIPPH